VFGYSKEQSKFSRYGRCPLCKAFPILPIYTKPDGTVISRLTLLPMMDRSALARCSRCNGQWPVFKQGVVPATAPASAALVAAPSAPPAPLEPAAPREVQIVETERTVEDHYVELMELDNLRGTTPLAREVTINEKWTEAYVVEAERARTLSGGGELGLGRIATLKASAEQAVTRKYSASQTMERTYTDRITIEVPARTKRVVSFIYRRVWQHGVIVVGTDDSQVEIPFKAAVDLNLDLAQEDSTDAD
jgi:hypothetical protein